MMGRGIDEAQTRESRHAYVLMLEEATYKRDATRYYYTPLDLLAWFQHTYPRLGVRPSHAYGLAVKICEAL